MSELTITKSHLAEFAKFTDPQNELLAAVAQSALDAHQKLDALAAENVALKLEVIELAKQCAQTTGEVELIVSGIETSATDAIINQQRAEGIIMFASKQLAAAGALESTITLERLMLDAEESAAQLYAGDSKFQE